MLCIPDHIEKYLQEAGFSPTELLILKRFLNGEVLTLRELAARTGKSTGVLDQATKKLMSKNILTRHLVNGSPRYALISFKAIRHWVKEDMRNRWEHMQRKEKDFETFITSIRQGNTQPVIEYYDGLKGLKQAYRKLLKVDDELLQFFPCVAVNEQGEDSLGEFRGDFIKERKKIGMFSRVIMHDTSLGRRYQSRDPFEHRRTVLVPENEYSFSFEKLIAGDMVACFNRAEEKACIIHFPDLARSERQAFEVIWGMMDQNKQSKLFTAIREMDFSHLEDDDNASRKRNMKFLACVPSWARDLMKILRVIPRVYVENNGAVVNDIEVFGKDRTGFIHDITGRFADRGIHIAKFGVYAVPPDATLYEIGFEARNSDEVRYITGELQRVPSVISVTQKA